MPGIDWALDRFAFDGDRNHASPARGAVHRAGGDGEVERPGWCTGYAGSLLASLCTGSASPSSDQLEAAVELLGNRPVLRDLSLCHGELGIADVLTVLAATHRAPVTVSARRRRAGLVLDAIERYGPTCGTPGGVSTPGLLGGLAGIGYGLLRLGFSDRVPSVLLLEPTPDLAERRPPVK